MLLSAGIAHTLLWIDPPLLAVIGTVQYIVLEIGTAGAGSLISNIDQEINLKKSAPLRGAGKSRFNFQSQSIS